MRGKAACGSSLSTQIALAGKGSEASRRIPVRLVRQELITVLPEVPFRAAFNLLSLFSWKKITFIWNHFCLVSVRQSPLLETLERRTAVKLPVNCYFFHFAVSRYPEQELPGSISSRTCALMAESGPSGGTSVSYQQLSLCFWGNPVT